MLGEIRELATTPGSRAQRHHNRGDLPKIREIDPIARFEDVTIDAGAHGLDRVHRNCPKRRVLANDGVSVLKLV